MKYAFKKPLYKFTIPIFDVLGYILFLPARLFRKRIPENPKNILVVRLDHIGDFVCTAPVFRNLKERYPDARVTALINSVSKDLAFRNPYIDKVISFSPFHLTRAEDALSLKGLMRLIKDIKAFDFDLGIETRGDLVSILLMWLGAVRYRIGYGITGGGFLLNKVCDYDESRHIIDRNLALLKGLDIPVTHRTPEVYFNEQDEDAIERLLSPASGGVHNDGLVVIHPFAGAKAKEWPKDNFQKIIEYLKNRGKDIILVGSDGDGGSFKDVIDMRGKLNLPQLACIMKRAGFFIGLDSGPANIAAALGIKTIVICSGTNIPECWLPEGADLCLIYKEVECRPCGLKICSEKNHKCMETVKAEDVVKIIKESWQL